MALGPLPVWDQTTEQEVDRRLAFLRAVALPVTDEEASSLIKLFGPDDYFGLGFLLRDLVESAPGWPLWKVMRGDNPWMRDVRGRAINSGFVPRD